MSTDIFHRKKSALVVEEARFVCKRIFFFLHYFEFEWCGKFTESLSEDDTRGKVFFLPSTLLATASARVPQADIPQRDFI
jgi:hypothetical protein